MHSSTLCKGLGKHAGNIRKAAHVCCSLIHSSAFPFAASALSASGLVLSHALVKECTPAGLMQQQYLVEQGFVSSGFPWRWSLLKTSRASSLLRETSFSKKEIFAAACFEKVLFVALHESSSRRRRPEETARARSIEHRCQCSILSEGPKLSLQPKTFLRKNPGLVLKCRTEVRAWYSQSGL